MTNAIQNAIDMAQQAAANHMAGQAPVATQQPAVAATAVAPVTRGAPLSVDDMLAGGLSVVTWAKYKDDGFRFGDDKKSFEDIEVLIDLAAVAYCFQIKYNFNGQTVYKKTYDRTTEVQGGSWMQAIAQAQGVDPRAYEYRSAEIPCLVLEDVQGKDGSVIIHKGESFGLGLSTTAWKNWQKLLDTARRTNMDPTNAVLKVKVGHELKQKQGVNDWGVPTFTILEELEIMPVFN